MTTQTIAWTTLPNGFTSEAEGAHARISVFVSPRLNPDGEGTLEAFDFLNWAALFEGGSIEFEVAFGTQIVSAAIVSRPQPAVWSALFGAQTLVRPHAFDAPSLVMGTYPAARMHDFVKTAYQSVGTAPQGPGRVRTALRSAFDGLEQLFQPAPMSSNLDIDTATEAGRASHAALVFSQPTPDALSAHLNLLVDLAMREAATRDAATTGSVGIVPDRGDTDSALTQFMVFHRQPQGTATTSNAVATNQADTRLDFHQQLTMLNEYPTLLRALGLIVDLHVESANIPGATSTNPGLVRVVPRLTSVLTEPALRHEPHVTPPTAYIFEPGRIFAASPRPSDEATTISGLTNLHLDGRYRLMQVDVDGAGLKLIELMRKSASNAAGDAAEVLELAALRSGGVTIALRGQADAMVSAMLSSGGTMSAVDDNTVLFEDHLIRGFRVDVGNSASGAWRSLHRRDVTCRLGTGEQTLTFSDEGWSQESVVHPTTGADGAVVPMSLGPTVPNYISEYLFNWQGWSLTASRPGASLPDPMGMSANNEAQRLAMTVEAVATKGSLPRLRFGRDYRVRLRTVDLAGNGLTLKEADRITAELGTEAPILPRQNSDEEFRFLRFEPVPPPVAVPRVTFAPQPTDDPVPEVRVPRVDRIVLRSDFDRTPDELAEQNPNYALDAERHFVPPPTYQQLAEMHGLFDASIGTGVNHNSTYLLACREEQALPKIHAETILPVDYLPDPLAAGAAFRNLPGMPQGKIGRVVDSEIQLSALAISADLIGEQESVLQIDFGTSWPNASSFRLRLAEGNGMPAWNSVDRVLTVFLPKGETRTVQVSSYLRNATALDMLGTWQWTRQRLRDQAAEGELSEENRLIREQQLKQLTMAGLAPMQFPPREITLVHAVQRPAGPEPALLFNPVRAGNTTFTYTRGDLRVPASANTVELLAAWSERIDTWNASNLTTDPANRPPDPSLVSFRAPVFASPFTVADSAQMTTTTNAPAQAFDPLDGMLRYPGPALEELTAAVNRAVEQLEAALNALLQAALPTEIAVVSFVDLAWASLEQARKFPTGPDSWAELSLVAVNIGGRAQSEANSISFDVFPGEPPQPIHLKQPYQDVATDAEALKSRADLSTLMLSMFLGRHEFGDTKYRHVTYQAVLTSRFGEDFTAAGLSREADFSRLSNTVTVDVPSSMPPVAPDVQAIVPAFAWNRTSSGTERRIQRRGALRVYLGRPWYTSGDGEMLGVIVLADPSIFPASTKPKEGTTIMGRDPLWTSPRSPIMAGPDNFGNERTNVYLGKHPNDPFASALLGFDVAFDKAGRCFCDIELVTPSYFPFIRLALVRYQPHSVEGASMSPLVTADFVQVAPERNISVVQSADNTLTISVSGTNHDSPDAFGRIGNRFQVTVQRRIRGTADDVGWLTDTEAGFTIATDAAAPQPPLLWSGTVTRPPTPVAGDCRLLIEELEPHTMFISEEKPAERVVFLETIAL